MVTLSVLVTGLLGLVLPGGGIYLIESGDAPPDILRLPAQDFVTRNQDLAAPERRLGGERCDPRITEMAALIGYRA